jgi:hypothetical protein
LEEKQAILNSIQEYENYGRGIILHSISNKNELSLEPKPQHHLGISGWNGGEIDLENAPQHLLPCSSLADAVIGRYDDSQSNTGTPYLYP